MLGSYQMLKTTIYGRKKALFSATGIRPATELRPLLEKLAKLIQDGMVKTVIDKTYPLADAAVAHRYVDTGHKKGNVVLIVE